MAVATKQKLARITTPRGVAVYPKLTTPDEYKGKSSYSTGIRITDEACAAIKAQIVAAAAAYFSAKEVELKAAIVGLKGAPLVAAKQKLAALTLHLPYKPDYDDAGEPNGSTIFKVKMNSSWKKPDGTVIEMKPTLFDAATPPAVITQPIDVWGGSVIKVNAELLPVYIDSSGGCGISLRMKGVQIIELRSGGVSAESMGFDGEDDGFDAGGLPDAAAAKPAVSLSDDDALAF